MELEPVQSLWIGPRLSVMERLVIQSFLDHGHPFHLYTYHDVEDIPAGTVVRPAAEILPAEQVFRGRRGYGRGSYAPFADGFRYKLLWERGGWWADLDAVCLRPLDFADEHVLGYEREPDGRLHVAIGLIKAPAGSRLLEDCWQHCRQIDRRRMGWGHTGPRLMAEALRRTRAGVRVLDPTAFYPIDYWRLWDLIRPGPLPAGAHSIHLWNSKWRRERLDRDAVYDRRCIYEQLKRRHDVASPPGAAAGPGVFVAARYYVRQWLGRGFRVQGSGFGIQDSPRGSGFTDNPDLKG